MSLGWSNESFIYSNITGSLQTHLNTRKKLVKTTSKRTNKDIEYLNSNTSWVKLSSGVDELIKNEKGEIEPSEVMSQEHVLLGGVHNDKTKSIKKGIFAKNSSYSYTQKFGFRPMAGITNTSINTHGTFGAIKKATVEFQVNSLDELEKFEKIYMLPGYSILLEWGHSIILRDRGKLDYNIQTFNHWFNDLYEHDEKNEQHRSALILKELERLRHTQNFHYDALYGKVSNYVWSFNPDGTYNCSIDIVGYGELAESMSAIFTPQPSEAEEKNISKTSVNRFYMYLKYIQNIYPTPAQNRLVSNLLIESENFVGPRDEGVPDILVALQDYFKNIVILNLENSKTEDGKGTSAKYVTFGSLLNFINDNFMLCDDGKPITRFYTGQFDTTKVSDEDLGTSLYKLDPAAPYENRTPFVTFDDHISTNMDVCFLAKAPSKTRIYDIVFAKDKAVTDCIKGNTDDILNILVNVQHVKDSYNEILKNNKNENINVYDFVMGILNDIAKSLGNINKFSIETRDQVMFIADRSGTPGRKDVTYKLDLFGLESLATNISLQSSIPSSLSTLIAIGASAGGSTLNENIFNFQSFYKNYVDRLVPKRELDQSVQDADIFSDEISKEDKKKLKKHSRILASYVRAINAKRTIIDQAMGNLIPAHQTVTNLLLKKVLIDGGHNSPGIIPIQLSFEIYGASGLRITDVFNIQEGLLPSRYKNNISFTITGIDNAISSNRWTTTVKAVMMVTTPLKEIMVSKFDLDEIFEDIDVPFPSEILQEGFPNATRVRNFMKNTQTDADPLFREKGFELTSSGMDITKKSADLAIKLMGNIHTQINGQRPFNISETSSFSLLEANKPETTLSSLRFRWTGGNDSFHLYNPVDGNTLHRFGKALDLAIQQDFDEGQAILAKQIVAKASKEVMSSVEHKFKDEYKKPSSHANGPHFHFAVGGANIKDEQENERKLIDEKEGPYSFSKQKKGPYSFSK